jgi:hypothetical protein
MFDYPVPMTPTLKWRIQSLSSLNFFSSFLSFFFVCRSFFLPCTMLVSLGAGAMLGCFSLASLLARWDLGQYHPAAPREA